MEPIKYRESLTELPPPHLRRMEAKCREFHTHAAAANRILTELVTSLTPVPPPPLGTHIEISADRLSGGFPVDHLEAWIRINFKHAGRIEIGSLRVNGEQLL